VGLPPKSVTAPSPLNQFRQIIFMGKVSEGLMAPEEPNSAYRAYSRLMRFPRHRFTTYFSHSRVAATWPARRWKT